jgi:hypothetical protein
MGPGTAAPQGTGTETFLETLAMPQSIASFAQQVSIVQIHSRAKMTYNAGPGDWRTRALRDLRV